MRLFSLLLCTSLGLLPAIACAENKHVEVGEVEWGRDFEASLKRSTESGKPVFVLFQEVPGCAGCKKFGREVLSDPQLVEAIETEFVPLLVYNNQPGKDVEILNRYGEPAWNFQVVRFLDGEGKDIIERKDGVWTVEGVAARMVRALESRGRDVPKYLQALAGRDLASNPGVAAFAMYCFWTGEFRLGGIEGVLTTQAGWMEGREVTLVIYDREKLSFRDLLAAAEKYDCANKVYSANEDDLSLAKESRLSSAPLTNDYRAAGASDQKRQLQGTPFEKLDLSPVQATKINAFARSNRAAALEWLSPGQLSKLKS